MIENEMMDQLKAVFEKLQNPVELVMYASEHPKQVELEDMLTKLASTSKNIVHVRESEEREVPTLKIKYKGQLNGVSFVGVPGGHEFSSLILAILNADGQGKLPDERMQNRIKSIKGPIKLRTFIALSCETCPDVVQALNLMASLHPNFEHQMIDGEFAQDEVESLKIQGVPSVMKGDELLHSGKISLVDLLGKLEASYGSQTNSDEKVSKDLGVYDMVVIGGGPAGASSAIYSARKGMKTAVITDRMGGQLQDTKAVENFISLPYTEGPKLSAALAEHMSEYEIEVLEHRRVVSVENAELKKLVLDSGEHLQTKAIIVATGAKWRELNVPGEKEYIGRGVAFCPHCDGPYYKGKDVAVVGGGNSGAEAAIDLANLVKSVTLIEFLPELKADQVLVDKLMSLENVEVIKNARTNQILGDGEKVIGLEYENREAKSLHTVDLDGVFVQIGLIPNSEFIKETVETNRYGEIIVDNKCKTDVPGIYAAGDVTTVPFKQIIISMGEGAKAALTAFEDQML